jgi:predicted membrane channel-forming protein YqfA (hemolysin III family)
MNQKDCVGCKITGTVTGIGIGGYLLNHAMKPATTRAHGLLLVLMGGSLISIGLSRALSIKI